MSKGSTACAQSRRASGDCVNCGQKTPGTVLCVECNKKNLQWQKNRRSQRKKDGLCPGCGLTPDTGKIWCGSCRARSSRNQNPGYHQKRYKDLVSQRRCVKCKRKVRSKKAHCRLCLVEIKAYRDNKIKKGLCAGCGKMVMAGSRTCKECSARYRKRHFQIKDEVFAAYGGYVCSCCNDNTKEFMEIDHINNDGARHRRDTNLPGGIYRWLKTNGFPAGFQVLCTNCNMAKYRYGECPHQRAKK